MDAEEKMPPDRSKPSPDRVVMTVPEYHQLRRSVVFYQHHLIDRARSMVGKVLPAQAEEARGYKAEADALLALMLKLDEGAYNRV